VLLDGLWDATQLDFRLFSDPLTFVLDGTALFISHLRIPQVLLLLVEVPRILLNLTIVEALCLELAIVGKRREHLGRFGIPRAHEVLMVCLGPDFLVPLGVDDLVVTVQLVLRHQGILVRTLQ